VTLSVIAILHGKVQENQLEGSMPQTFIARLNNLHCSLGATICPTILQQQPILPVQHWQLPLSPTTKVAALVQRICCHAEPVPRRSMIPVVKVPQTRRLPLCYDWMAAFNDFVSTHCPPSEFELKTTIT
jgi:hypothetical protein